MKEFYKINFFINKIFLFLFCLENMNDIDNKSNQGIRKWHSDYIVLEVLLMLIWYVRIKNKNKYYIFILFLRMNFIILIVFECT